MLSHNGSRISQTNYFIVTPVAKHAVFSLFLLHLNGGSERNVIPRRDEKASSYSNSLIKVHELELFLACLAAVMTQTTAAKKTRLVIHSSKRKDLGNTVLARLQCVIYLAKPKKTKTHWTEIRKTAIIVENTRNQRLTFDSVF